MKINENKCQKQKNRPKLFYIYNIKYKKQMVKQMSTEKKKYRTLAIDEVLKTRLDRVMIMMGERLTYSEIISILVDTYTAGIEKNNETI